MLPSLLINQDKDKPKYIQVVDAITEAIRKGYFKRGERIHSINEFSEEYLLSRDTVGKAYNILRQKGIIQSLKGKGFYVRQDELHVTVKVLLLFNKISNYKKQVYHAFLQTLGNQALVDLKIHHFNTRIFKSLIERHLTDYHYFVIMPHFYDDPDEARRILRVIPPDQLILLDRKVPHLDFPCSMVYQDFENDIVDALEQGLDLLKKYNQLVLVHPTLVPYPQEIVYGFRSFCIQQDLKGNVIPEITQQTEVQKGQAYVVIEETDLVCLIKNCQSKGLKIGKDVGIISYNETPLKEILLDGITVISTDHARMGETAARLILENRTASIKNPFTLIRRKSL